MSEEGKVEVNKNPNHLGFNQQRHGRREEQPLNAGNRVLVPSGEGKRNPAIYVERGSVGNYHYCEQEFMSKSQCYSWKEYARDGIKAKGVLLEDMTLFWIPFVKNLPMDEMHKIAGKKHPNSSVLVSFSFGKEEVREGTVIPEIVLSVTNQESNSLLNSVVDYFGRSLGFEEGIRLLIYKAGEESNPFDGSIQEYQASSP